MKTKIYTVEGIAGDEDKFVAATATTAGTALTLLAAAADIDPPQELAFTTTGDMTAVTLTIVGTDRSGNQITEEIVLPDTSAVLSKKVYASITSITPDATNAETVAVGTTGDRTTTPWVICGLHTGVDQMSTCKVSVVELDGSADGIVEVTYDYPNNGTGDELAVDETVAVAPGTPAAAQGIMCRFVLTSGENTGATIRFGRPG